MLPSTTPSSVLPHFVPATLTPTAVACIVTVCILAVVLFGTIVLFVIQGRRLRRKTPLVKTAAGKSVEERTDHDQSVSLPEALIRPIIV